MWRQGDFAGMMGLLRLKSEKQKPIRTYREQLRNASI